MKKILVLFAAVLFGCSTSEPVKVENEADYSEENVDAAVVSPPFSKGVNFSGWFEANNANSISFTKYVERDFANVKSLGADVVRLPIHMHNMTGGPPDYAFDPLFFKFLDMAVSWAEKYGIYLLIDNHSFDPVKNTDNDIDKILISVWEQVAGRYKDRGEYIIYEILNEPHGISDARWGEIQGMAINAIRKYDAKHFIIVGGADFNSINKLSAIPKYADSKLIYTFHFYDPFLFTHQGASWTGEPALTKLAGVPFPYDSKRKPKIPFNLRGTWVEKSLNNDYKNASDPKTLYSTLDKAASFSKERNVPVFCGEFGVLMNNSLNNDRVRWYKIVTAALDRRNISRTSWDYYGGFGLFKADGKKDFYEDMNTDVALAMGFTPPVQTPRKDEPLKTGFTIYDDYPSKEISCGIWDGKADFSFYDANAAQGEFSIRWGNASKYSTIYFNFDRNGDFSEIANNGVLEFKARADKSALFDIRFLNHENESSIPWRMNYTIDDKILPPDGKWHTIQIPLNSMKETGAWVDSTKKWINPQNKFSWSSVNQLNFSAEHGEMKGIYVWFDDIKLIVP